MFQPSETLRGLCGERFAAYTSRATPERPDSLFRWRLLLCRTAVHSLRAAAFAHGGPHDLEDVASRPRSELGAWMRKVAPPLSAFQSRLQGDVRSPMEARTLAKLFAEA